MEKCIIKLIYLKSTPDKYYPEVCQCVLETVRWKDGLEAEAVRSHKVCHNAQKPPSSLCDTSYVFISLFNVQLEKVRAVVVLVRWSQIMGVMGDKKTKAPANVDV